MKIKKALTEDIESAAELFDLYRQFYEQKSDIDSAKKFLSERITMGESVIFISEDEQNNRAAGFVQLYPSFSSVGMKKIWILNDLFVREEYRKQGVAESLILKAKVFATETSAAGIILETQISNINAQRLYDKLGFNKDDEHYFYFLKTEGG